jgi:mitochondrial fission protein ELM1
MPTPKLSIWRFRDGKPGHEQQSLGLVTALGELAAVDLLDFDVREHSAGLIDWALGRFPAGLARRRPDLLIGAGHATHLPMLAARRVAGGRIVVLMRPSLPVSFFDYIIAPEHDGMTPANNVLLTRGVLNAMKPGEKKPDSLLILLGGQSKHADWDESAIQQQIETVIAHLKPGSVWRIADSRRTPPAFSRALQEKYGERFQPWADCPPGWMAQRLAVTDMVWVSEDSVSMIYESLSAGCRVGILKLPAAKPDRVLQGVQKLQDDGLVKAFDPDSTALPPVGMPLCESARAAQWLLRSLPDAGAAP